MWKLSYRRRSNEKRTNEGRGEIYVDERDVDIISNILYLCLLHTANGSKAYSVAVVVATPDNLPGREDEKIKLQTHSYCCIDYAQRKAASKIIESYLLWKLPLVKYGLKPDHPFEEDYASCQMAILPQNFFLEADKGMINFKRASNWWFYEGGVEFEDNTKIEADVVLLATGYDGKKKLRDVMPQPFSSFLEFPSGMMPLYRGTINPFIPNMAFMGYVESVSNLHTSEIRCKWLARLIGGKFKLPSMEKMMEQIATEMEIMKKTTRFYKRSCISTFSINHTDEICQEMGWNSRRKNNWLAEAFTYIWDGILGGITVETTKMSKNKSDHSIIYDQLYISICIFVTYSL
ncbi:probable flavin-containing monooxygenase 1 [Tanacetum coccineum]